jgi:putative DNA primase/helicase
VCRKLRFGNNGDEGRQGHVLVGEILEDALGIEAAKWTRADQMRVTVHLKSRGWQRYQARLGPGREAPREWRYRPA